MFKCDLQVKKNITVLSALDGSAETILSHCLFQLKYPANRWMKSIAPAHVSWLLGELGSC